MNSRILRMHCFSVKKRMKKKLIQCIFKILGIYMQYKVPKILQWDIYKHIYSTFLPGFYFVYWISRPEVYKWRPKITRDTVSTLGNVHSKTESILQIPNNQQWIPITFRNFSWRCESTIGFKMVIKINMYVQHVNM